MGQRLHRLAAVAVADVDRGGVFEQSFDEVLEAGVVRQHVGPDAVIAQFRVRELHDARATSV